MQSYTFIDRYFHSQNELLDIRFAEERDINTLFTYLNNLHSTVDKLKELFDCDIKSFPEFKVLRMLRNFFHHGNDVDEIRMAVTIDKNIIVSHSQHIIIPLETFSKSIKSFIDKNTVSEGHKNYKRKMQFVSKEMASISECFSYCADILNNMEACCDKPSLKIDGKVYELGFDMYKFAYNVSNLIADKCRNIEELSGKKSVTDLDNSYTVANNIRKLDVQCLPNAMPIMTTEGFIYPGKVEAAI